MSALPSNLEVTRNVEGDEAELLFDIVHEEGFVHDIDGAIGDQLLEVIGEGLTTKVNTLGGIVDGEVLEHRGSMCEGESTVDDEAALGLGDDASGPKTGLVEMSQRW